VALASRVDRAYSSSSHQLWRQEDPSNFIFTNNTMTKQLKHFIKGLGSVVDLAPTPRASRFVPRESDADRLRGDFERIGIDMTRAWNTQRKDGEASRPQNT
jgi:hypothetical protein